MICSSPGAFVCLLASEAGLAMGDGVGGILSNFKTAIQIISKFIPVPGKERVQFMGWFCIGR